MIEFSLINESILTEEVALLKGSQRVMNDKKLVAGIADTLRDDSRAHPGSFPAGSFKTFQKLPDEQLARWFLENLDKIEKAGYEGTHYTPADKPGVNSEWIARRYIAGSHNWEDITGVMNMNLRDWYLLKNRNLLSPNHSDIPKFNSVRDIGAYVNTHYERHLKDIRDAAKTAALKKTAKSANILDNDDYKIYTVFNRNAARMVGLGTQWCTANSENAGNYENYSSKAMLFQVFPKDAAQDEKGRPEKFQFDASGHSSFSPAGYSFKDFLDQNVNPKVVAERFPYLYTDLVKALKEKGSALETAMKELTDDPTLQSKDAKTKVYNISDEIKKLGNMKNAGFFTDKVRPAKKSEQASSDEQPQIQQNPEQGNQAMESIRELAEAMLSIESEELNEFYHYEQSDKGKKNDAFKKKEDKDAADKRKQEKSDWKKKQSGKLDEEENTIKGKTMENVDKDVAAMLSSLKKYDILKESVAPVLGMRTMNEKKKPDFPDIDKDGDKKESIAKAAKDKEEVDESEDKNPWEKLASDKKDDDAKTSKTSKGGTVTKTEKGLVHKAADKKDDVKEAVAADEEVLAWMGRFAKLGNMKGYGR